MILRGVVAKLEFIDLKEAADQAGVTRRAVERWVVDGLLNDDDDRVYLTAVRIGGTYYVEPDELDEFLDIRDAIGTEEN